MWTLLLSRMNDPPGVYFDRRQLDSGEIRIGRSAKTCDIVLPNEDGLISRTHCTITAVGLDLFATDSSTNGVALNTPSARILPHQPVPIRVRDRLIIHNFVVTVLPAEEGASVGLSTPAPTVPDIPETGGGAGDSFFDVPNDPFWNDGGPGGGAVHDFLSGGNAGFGQPPPMEAPGQHPPDFGFGGGIGEAFSRPIMADLQPAQADFAIPENWAGDFGGAEPAPARFVPGHGPDPFADLSPPVAPPADAFSGQFDPFGDPGPFGADFVAQADPARVIAPQPAAVIHTPPEPPPRPAPGTAAAPDWAAFYEGAGLSPHDLPLAPDALFKLGQLYRQVVLGMCDILQDRAAFKDEFRVERTQISHGQNNPLKHLPAIEAAKVLLGKPLPGFMPMEEAVRTSLEDLKKHQLAMLAGVQNALLVVFDRLSPAEIEQFAGKVENQKRGLLGRRAPDRWAIYMTVFEALRRDATGNANGVMSVAFREGYEKFMKTAR